jgi:lysophospholipase L1-like esterase
LQPDLLTVSFGWNDASLSDATDREAIRTNWSSVAVRWLIDHSQAFAHATRWLRARETKRSGTGEPPAYAGGSDKWRVVTRPIARVSQVEYVNNMLAIESLARRQGAAVIVIAAPYRDHSAEAPEANLMWEYRAALGQTMRQRGIPFLEILELTEEAYPANEGWFGERIHPNHMGHRLMASELLKLIDSKRSLGDLTIPELIP